MAGSSESDPDPFVSELVNTQRQALISGIHNVLSSEASMLTPRIGGVTYEVAAGRLALGGSEVDVHITRHISDNRLHGLLTVVCDGISRMLHPDDPPAGNLHSVQVDGRMLEQINKTNFTAEATVGHIERLVEQIENDGYYKVEPLDEVLDLFLAEQTGDE